MTRDAWDALAVEVARVAALIERGGVNPDLRWRASALGRAVATRNPELLPLALGATGRNAPEASIAWSYDGVCDVGEFAEATLWHLADAALELCDGAGVEDLDGTRRVIDAWETRAR